MKGLGARHKNVAGKKRNLRNLLTSKKAISSVFATLLLVIITFAVGIVFYNYVTGCIGSMENNYQKQMELLFLKSASINTTCITSFVGNNGIWDIIIMNAYVNNQLSGLSRNVNIEKGSVKPVYITGTYTKGLSYAVKLVTNFGSSLAFTVTYN